MNRNIAELTTLLLTIKDGQFDVINNRAVLREHGYFLVEGSRNKRETYNQAAARLARAR